MCVHLRLDGGCVRRFTLSVTRRCVARECGVCPHVSYTHAKQRDRDATQCSVLTRS